MVMPSNNTDWLVDYWQGRYGNLGHLYSPQRLENPRPHIPYVCDNGAYYAWKNRVRWDRQAWEKHVNRYGHRELKPLWILAPDRVTNRIATLALWRYWAPLLKKRFPDVALALAVQDGMTAEDVQALESQPDLLFVGGSTEWKWRTVRYWCKRFARVHVGRVNTGRQLEVCNLAGAESVDGTGWFKGDAQQILDLGYFLARQAGMDTATERDHLLHVVRFSRTMIRRPFRLRKFSAHKTKQHALFPELLNEEDAT